MYTLFLSRRLYRAGGCLTSKAPTLRVSPDKVTIAAGMLDRSVFEGKPATHQQQPHVSIHQPLGHIIAALPLTEVTLHQENFLFGKEQQLGKSQHEKTNISGPGLSIKAELWGSVGQIRSATGVAMGSNESRRCGSAVPVCETSRRREWTRAVVSTPRGTEPAWCERIVSLAVLRGVGGDGRAWN